MHKLLIRQLEKEIRWEPVAISAYALKQSSWSDAEETSEVDVQNDTQPTDGEDLGIDCGMGSSRFDRIFNFFPRLGGVHMFLDLTTGTGHLTHWFWQNSSPCDRSQGLAEAWARDPKIAPMDHQSLDLESKIGKIEFLLQRKMNGR